jgi:hypothetical protein
MNPDKDRHKQLKQTFKQNEQHQKAATMPVSKEDLADLFDFLDENLDDESGTDFALTTQFLEERNLPVETTLTWLRQRGGNNDSEVLWNVEEQFEE